MAAKSVASNFAQTDKLQLNVSFLLAPIWPEGVLLPVTHVSHFEMSATGKLTISKGLYRVTMVV